MNRLAVILDKSGSMGVIQTDTIGSFNSWLKDIRAIDANRTAHFTLTMFDTVFSTRFDGPIREAGELTTTTYQPGGNTALLDAIGVTVAKMKAAKKKGDRCLVVIITDGQENSSRQYTKTAIKALIESLQKKKWEFLFIGAEINAFAEAASIGIPMAQTYSTDYRSYGTTSTGTTASTANWSQGGTSAALPDLQDLQNKPKTPTPTP